MPEAARGQVAIVDYGMGNLFSVEQACDQAGLGVVISSSAKEILAADAVILPGVGAFGDAMANLNRLDLNLIAFRLRHQAEGGGGRDFYNRVMKLLDNRFTYHHTLWSYALYHRDEERLGEEAAQVACDMAAGAAKEAGIVRALAAEASVRLLSPRNA